jgi:hypothetical protein
LAEMGKGGAGRKGGVGNGEWGVGSRVFQ